LKCNNSILIEEEVEREKKNVDIILIILEIYHLADFAFDLSFWTCLIKKKIERMEKAIKS